MTGLVEKKNRIGTRYFEDEDGGITAKECTGCGEVKIMGDFNKCKKMFGGRKSQCKSCCATTGHKYYEENFASIASKSRKYYEENRDYISEQARKYYKENRASVSERGRKYYKENRASVSERHRKYREENRDYVSERGRKYYKENCASILERQRKYREENRDRISEYQRKYYEENSDYISEQARKYQEENRASVSERHRKYHEENRTSRLEKQRKYHKENPHVGFVSRHRRRARKSLLPDTLTKEQLEEITDRFRGGCALTGCTDGTHLDHAIPVVIGHGGTTEQNMIPLRADLNISKHARCIFDWFYDVKDYFKLSQTKFDELIEYLAHINGMTADEYEGYVRGCHDNPRVIDETILDETGSAG